jgi:pimeloyl-ACP methyl ester carboxylesterase
MKIAVNGTRLWFDVEGPVLVPEDRDMRERPTVVLLHGGPGSFDHSYFKPAFSRLAETAQVIYLDLRDHGRSARGNPEDWNFEICADDIRTFCEALGVSRPIVLGHSLGGYIAMLYAIRHPGHAGALILQSTNARFDLERIVEHFRAPAATKWPRSPPASTGGPGPLRPRSGSAAGAFSEPRCRTSCACARTPSSTRPVSS